MAWHSGRSFSRRMSAKTVVNYSRESVEIGKVSLPQLILAATSLGGAVGALAFFWQFSLLQSALRPQEKFDYLDQTVNAPASGVILGGVAGLVFALLHLHRKTTAMRFSISGGLLVIAFIISQFVYGYWENRSVGFDFSMQDIVIRCLPMYGGALLWSFCLVLWGLFLRLSAGS